MIKTLSVEWLKTKRTAIRWVLFLAPVAFSAFIIGYFSLRVITDKTQIFIFQTFFEVWTALVMPIAAGLITGFLIHQEEMAGGFNGLFASKLPRLELYLGKLLMLVLLIASSTLLAISTLVLGLSYFAHIPVFLPIFISAAIMTVLSIIPLLAFHLWISFAWGMGASIGFGGIGILIASLMATSLGDTVWYFVPWAWPVRLSMLLQAYLLYLPGMTPPPSSISSGFVINELMKGLVPAASFLAIMLAGGLLWFYKWEGRKTYD